MEAEYSPLSTLRVDSPRLKADAFIHAARELFRRPSPTRIRYSFMLRTGVFTLMELGFIILASFSIMNPIPIHLSSNVTFVEAKGAVTIISILWHTLAAVAAKDILLYIFSAEWIHQYRRSGSITFGETDSVSRLTAGYIDQIKHFFSRRATISFRLAFISVLLLIPLNGLGPSAITTNYVSHEFPLGIKVANLTLIDNTTPAAPEIIGRAGMITRLEQVENANYGFSSQQNNMLIPWPSLDSLPANTTVRYKSDVIKFDFNCSWTQPTISQPDWGEVNWVVGGRGWSTYYTTYITLLRHTRLVDAILPLILRDEKKVEAYPVSLIPILFVGTNTTLSRYIVLNLEDIPALYIPTDLTPTPGYNGSVAKPVLASVLLCDPQFTVSPATVTATGSTLEAVIHPGSPNVGNIPVEVANMIYSQSLLDALSNVEDAPIESLVNPIARVLFFAKSSFEVQGPEGDKPLPINEINNQMNKVLLSSAKAYLSGYSPQSSFFHVFNTMDADAVGKAQQLALVGSKPFLIALIAVVGVLVILLIILLVIMKMDQLQLFDLENIVKILRLH